MERRIKTLYIITIVAILAFLGMQVYWLYGRYEFALSDYERNLTEKILKCVDDYKSIREKTSNTRTDSLKQGGNGADAFSCLHSHYSRNTGIL